MAIKAIIFDCFGVLVMSGRTALYHDFPDLKSKIYDNERQSDYGMTSRIQLNEAIGQLTHLSPQVIDERYWATSVRNESALAWAMELKQSGEYKIGLLSNIGRGWLEDFLTVQERRALFDAEVLSSEVNIVKPSLEIFEITAQRLGVEPFECVMIDDILANIDGAERAGMGGILFGTTTQARSDLDLYLKSHNA
ncbi:HAD-IA family hydrolase [Candidatus Saccharibacteria bacterium]|nr:HAD-IA family hydrolase [Candidatus Saccharibacteria bacterium]